MGSGKGFPLRGVGLGRVAPLERGPLPAICHPWDSRVRLQASETPSIISSWICMSS